MRNNLKPGDIVKLKSYYDDGKIFCYNYPIQKTAYRNGSLPLYRDGELMAGQIGLLIERLPFTKTTVSAEWIVLVDRKLYAVVIGVLEKYEEEK